MGRETARILKGAMDYRKSIQEKEFNKIAGMRGRERANRGGRERFPISVKRVIIKYHGGVRGKNRLRKKRPGKNAPEEDFVQSMENNRAKRGIISTPGGKGGTLSYLREMPLQRVGGAGRGRRGLRKHNGGAEQKSQAAQPIRALVGREGLYTILEHTESERGGFRQKGGKLGARSTNMRSSRFPGGGKREMPGWYVLLYPVELPIVVLWDIRCRKWA